MGIFPIGTFLIHISRVKTRSNIIKNVSSSTSHQKTPSLRHYEKLKKNNIHKIYIYMNADIAKTQFFISWCMTSKVIEGHRRSSFYFKIHFFFNIIFVWNLFLSKFVMNANIKKTKIWPQKSQFFFYVSNLILPKFDMNANTIKMQIFDYMKFDLIISFTYVVMDNFCLVF